MIAAADAISTTILSGAAPASHHGLDRDPGRAFADVLRARARAEGGQMERLREAAGRLVSSAFILPVLASLRESPFRNNGPFAPGVGERRFGPLLDQRLADAVTTSPGFTLTDSIVARYARDAGADPVSPRDLTA